MCVSVCVCVCGNSKDMKICGVIIHQFSLLGSRYRIYCGSPKTNIFQEYSGRWHALFKHAE